MRMNLNFCGSPAFGLIFLVCQVQGQVLPAPAGVPQIGKPCPEFILNDVQYFSKKKVSLKDFKGKPLILDFFATGCAACFQSFPETNQLQKEFGGKVWFLLVGKDDDQIRHTYEKFRRRYDLKMPVAYEAKLLTQFGIRSFPHLVWIDADGVVRAITDQLEATRENIQAFLEGNTSRLLIKKNEFELEAASRNYDYEKPYLVNNNGGNDGDFLHRSLLSRWNRDNDMFSLVCIDSRTKNKVETIGSPMSELYKLAYGDTVPPWMINPSSKVLPSSYGKYWPKLILETKDSALFQYDPSCKNCFSYSLIVPPEKASVPYLQGIMQRDLQAYFGYSVTLETRMMPCWKMTATTEASSKLKTMGGPHARAGNHAGISFTNYSIAKLILSIAFYYQWAPPILDYTGIEGNIDIDVDAVMNEWSDVKMALQKNGLNLEKGEKEMKVIVIRDPNE